jgi:hypothetical protein
VEVDEGAEGAFFGGFDVIRDKFADEVTARSIEGEFVILQGEGVGDKLEVIGEGVGGVGDFEEVEESGNDVVGKVGSVGDGDNAVGIGGIGAVSTGIEGLSGVDESGLVEKLTLGF